MFGKNGVRTLLKHDYYLCLAKNISALAVLIDLLLEDVGYELTQPGVQKLNKGTWTSQEEVRSFLTQPSLTPSLCTILKGH